MAKTNKIRIKLKAYHHKILDAAVEKIVKTAKSSGATIVGPVPLPTEEKQVYTILEQYTNIRIHANNLKCVPIRG